MAEEAMHEPEDAEAFGEHARWQLVAAAKDLLEAAPLTKEETDCLAHVIEKFDRLPAKIVEGGF